MTEPADPAGLTGRRWTFGAVVLDERSLELQVEGQLVPVERKPLEVLLYLLHHAGEVVTKDDLAENLWPGRVLTETVLTRCISVLRQTLKDNDRTLIRTVHGFGYRLVAEVKVEVPEPTSAAPELDFRPGDHPPARPQWKLVERLGTGGHGEAWLARHEKTGDARVFKFALDTASLSSLKREITLYRLLHDSLGQRAAVARILEWNLTEPPYFIEMEHVAGGNLQAWSDAQGGLAGIPMASRLELIARVADAVAAAHSVGALHKDLKPGNVLIQTENGTPVIRLCDFGSGGVLDPQRLEALGITRHGFTATLADGTTSATPLYIAPEVIAGQPFTIQADIYSLGVLLYQVVAGDLRKTLAPGWESDVADELLREDIGLAAAGNPAKRLTDAAQLVERLQSLDARRDAKAAEAAEQKRAERARNALAELRRVRVYAALLLVLSTIAVAGGIAAYRARNEAVAATATAEAISGFLMEDVLRTESGIFKPSEASYETLLSRASEEAGIRLKSQPKAQASVHWLLGRRYQDIGQFEAAIREYERAVPLLSNLYGEAAEPTLMALDRLAWVYLEHGRVAESVALAERIRALWASQLPASDLATPMVRIRLARISLASGDYATSERELRTAVHETASADASVELVTPLFKQWLGINPTSATARSVLAAYGDSLLAGVVLEETGDGRGEAEAKLRDSLSILSAALGEGAELSVVTSLTLAVHLAAAGRTEEAEKRALQGGRAWEKLLPDRHFGQGLSRLAVGRVRLEQGRFSDAITLFQEAVDLCALGSGCPPRVRAEFLLDLGTAFNEQGLARAAIPVLREALGILEKLFGRNHVIALRAQLGLADALRREGKLNEASDVLAGLSKETAATLTIYQQARADLRRTEGLLSLEKRDFRGAVVALQESLEICSRRAGSLHWRTQRARNELVAAKQRLGADLKLRGAQRSAHLTTGP